MAINLLGFMLGFGLFLKCIEHQDVRAAVKFTSVKCLPLDLEFLNFEYCFVKAVNRTYKYLNIKAVLLQVPVNNATITIDVRKRANGYKPFLYNITVDACKFLNRRKNPLMNVLYTFFKKYTNMNHSCPYNHDILVEKFDENVLNHNLIDLLPVPEGQYGVYVTWVASYKMVARIEFFFQIGRI